MSLLFFSVLCFGGLCFPVAATAGDSTCRRASGAGFDCADDDVLPVESKGSVLLQVSDPKMRSGQVLLQEELAKDSEEAEAGTAVACTSSGLDPWSSGSHVPCCSGLQDCVKNWNGGGRWFFRCFASCSDPEPDTTTTSMPAPSPTPIPAASGPSITLKFFEWNVWYRNKDTRRMAEVVKPNSPDVIGLNEFTASGSSMRSHLNEQIQGRNYDMQPGWTHFDGYGTYIFYDRNRFDAIEGGVESVHCSGTRGGNRAANWVVLRERSTNGLLITGGIHLSYCSGGCDWVHECELGRTYDRFYSMKSKYPGARVVWMGDLNRSPSSRIVKNLLQGQLGDRQVFTVQDLSQSPHRTYMSGGVIDHIFGESSTFSRLEGGNTGQGQPHQRLNGADHFPVYAKVQWNPSGESAPPAATITPQPSSSPSPPSSGRCQAQQVQRRRYTSSCSCRRRHGVSSTGQYECVGNTIVLNS